LELQTKIQLEPQSHNQIDYNSELFLLGSCFVENIGNKLDYFKFQNTINPFGILFHPKAIETLIENAIVKKEYVENEVFLNNEQWHCFDAHSKLSNSSKVELLKGLNQSIELTNKLLHESTHIIITLGTSWVYRLDKTNTIVANCHKVRQKEFLKSLLSIDDIYNSLQNSIDLIHSVNKKASIIFTVSPVRHLKDGFVENTRSKSHLITAIHQTIEAEKQSHYFPSYEIMMDELRDYRFYDEDMIHPNQTAVNYIWEKFKEVWISKKASIPMEDVDTIQKGLLHKPFNPSSKAHQQFIQQLDEKKGDIKARFPHIKF
jgi:hypothetical protein